MKRYRNTIRAPPPPVFPLSARRQTLLTLTASMAIKLHDSLTRETRELRPAHADGVFRFYNCGPTVYAAAHIGHPRLLELLATPQLLIRQQDELEMRALAQTLSLDPLSLLDAARQGLAQGTQAAFWFCAGVAALSTVVSLGLPRYSIRSDHRPDQ